MASPYREPAPPMSPPERRAARLPAVLMIAVAMALSVAIPAVAAASSPDYGPARTAK